MRAPRRLLLSILAAGLLAGCGDRSAPSLTAAAEGLDPARYASYREQVLPRDTERGWEQIEWHTTYADGLRASSDAKKPLLLWVMNGHPLGCT